MPADPLMSGPMWILAGMYLLLKEYWQVVALVGVGIVVGYLIGR